MIIEIELVRRIDQETILETKRDEKANQEVVKTEGKTKTDQDLSTKREKTLDKGEIPDKNEPQETEKTETKGTVKTLETARKTKIKKKITRRRVIVVEVETIEAETEMIKVRRNTDTDNVIIS